MDDEDLRSAFLEANREKLTPKEEEEDPFEYQGETSEYLGDLPALIKMEAHKIQAQFASVTGSRERRELETHYAQLDGWMGRLNEIDALEDREEASRLQGELRGKVLDEFRNWRGRGAPERKRLGRLERERKILRDKGKAGAGAVTKRRIKVEIELMIKNYSPSNEAKIEALIDKWRRSGDPSYDPSIKMKLRAARKKRDESSNPI